MFGRQHHVRRAEQSVRTGGEHLDAMGRRCLIGGQGVLGDRERDVRTGRAPNPVLLHRADLVGPVDVVQVGQQPLGVCGDPHHPLGQRFAEHREVAAFTATVGGDFLIGQDGAQARAPVDDRLRAVDQPVVVDDLAPLHGTQIRPGAVVRAGARRGCAQAVVQLVHQLVDGTRAVLTGVVPGVEDLQEDPLRPPVVTGVGGRERAALVVGQAQAAQLAFEHLDVGVRRRRRMLPGRHRVLLGRQAERVEPHCVQDILTAHAQVARVHIGADETQRMPDVQAGTGRVGKHVHHVAVRPDRHPVETLAEITARVGGVERSLGLPAVLPTGLYRVRQRGVVTEGRGAGGRGAGVRRVRVGRIGAHSRKLLSSTGPRTCEEPLPKQRLSRADEIRAVSATR